MKRVKVFHLPTRNDSMIITIDEEPLDVDIETLAQQFLDKEIYIGWPHLREAKVCAVSDIKTKIENTGIDKFDGSNGNGEFKILAKHVKEQYVYFYREFDFFKFPQKKIKKEIFRFFLNFH